MSFLGDNGLLGGALNVVFGGPTSAEKNLSSLAKGYGSSDIQKFLPKYMRAQYSDPIIQSGMQGIADLLQNPGSLSPNVSAAIQPQLANESQNIAQNFQNLQSNQAGAAARGNLPVSIKDALSSALGVDQERAQREARMQALSQSGQLQRSDTEQLYKLLDIINQFITSGRGGAINALGIPAQLGQQRQAANESFVGSLIGGLV